MRWDRLLADIEAAEAARERAEMLGEAAERSRMETGRVSLEARLRAAEGRPVVLEVDGPQRCAGRLAGVGLGWVVVEGAPASWLVATRHVLWVADLPRQFSPPPEGAAKRLYESLGIRHVLRGIAADRSAVQIGLGTGEPLTGTIDRVGADFVDLAVHAPGELRRTRELRGERAVHIDAIRYVRRQADG